MRAASDAMNEGYDYTSNHYPKNYSTTNPHPTTQFSATRIAPEKVCGRVTSY